MRQQAQGKKEETRIKENQKTYEKYYRHRRFRYQCLLKDDLGAFQFLPTGRPLGDTLLHELIPA
jgi:hypothetical protein